MRKQIRRLEHAYEFRRIWALVNSLRDGGESAEMADSHELPALLRHLIPGSPFAGKAFLVGGCVRDELRGFVADDVDAVVEEAGGAERLAAFLHARYPGQVTRPHELGAGYPIWQVVFRENIMDGGRTFLVAGCELEIADTQREMFPDPLTRARIATFGTLDEDCARRDFCCNMLYRDLTTGEIRDPSGCGVDDVQAGRLRGHPSVSLEKIFTDDPLRILRLIRFHCRFGWTIDAEGIRAAIATRERLKILSAERVRDELLKMMTSGHFERGLELCREWGLLDVLFPALLPMVGCTQDRIYHSEGDVWVHTLLVVRHAVKTPLQQLTALLHDLGKPPTRSEHGERVKFLGHEKISVNLAREFLARWKFAPGLSGDVLKLIELHLRGSNVQNWKGFRAARKFLRDVDPLVDELLAFIEADSRSSLGPEGEPRLEHVRLLREALTAAQLIPPRATPLLGGHEIMTLLNLRPGPRIKEVQSFLLELEDQWAERGQVLPVGDARAAVLTAFAPQT